MAQQNQRFAVRRLKYTMLVVYALLALCGCGSSRKVVYSEESIVREDTTWRNVSYLHGMTVRLSDVVGTHAGVKIRYTKYDTDKPSVPETGLPPVLETGEVDVALDQVQNIEVSAVDSTRVQEEAGASSAMQGSTRDRKTTEREETNLFKYISHIITGIIVLLALTWMYKLYKRFF